MKYTDKIFWYHHPGHQLQSTGSSVTAACHAHIKILENIHNYFNTLSSSRICLVGSGSSGSNSCRHIEWTLRKYYEAAASGCVVLGDVPADSVFAQFIPEHFNGLNASDIAQRVEEMTRLHMQGEYRNVQQSASEYVLSQRTCDSVFEQYYLPGLRDYIRGGRTGGVYVSKEKDYNITSNKMCSIERAPHRHVGMANSSHEGIIWQKKVLLAAPQDSGDMPAVVVEVYSDHVASPEQQVFNFCEMYQITEMHCQVLLRSMHDASLRRG